MTKIYCVLLLDDDELNNMINRKLFSKITSIEKLEIIENPANALTFIDKFHLEHNKLPEYIITDINMPGMSGFEFIETLAKKYPLLYKTVKIVFMSASINKKDLAILKKFENVDYFEKPFNTKKIETVFNIKI